MKTDINKHLLKNLTAREFYELSSAIEYHLEDSDVIGDQQAFVFARETSDDKNPMMVLETYFATVSEGDSRENNEYTIRIEILRARDWSCYNKNIHEVELSEERMNELIQATEKDSLKPSAEQLLKRVQNAVLKASENGAGDETGLDVFINIELQELIENN